MRARLDDLNARGLELRFGDTTRVVLGEMATLRGDLIQESGNTVIESAAATRAEVATLHLAFGTTVIVSDAGIVFDEPRGSFRNETEHVRCDLQADRADGVRIQLAFGLPSGNLVISGRAVLTGARLKIENTSGAVFAEKLALTDAVLELAGTKLDVDSLEGVQVSIEWSPAGVHVRAASATLGAASTAAALSAPTATPAPLTNDPAPAPGPSLRSGPWHGNPGPTPTPTRPMPGAVTEPALTEPAAAEPGGLLPLAVQKLIPLLDGLAGQLDVDLGLDLTVPVLGHRRATHKFRIPIENGALDYRKLESDLSALEDSLLDFSMREDVLVLEMGIPFLPTRGMGKPLLRWDVVGDDVALAHQNRIRLAMLPQFHATGDDSGDDGGGGSGKPPVSLNELSLHNLEGNLRLEHATPPAALPLRRIGELVVRAELHHAVATPSRDGTVAAQLAGVELGPMNIALGPMTLGFRAVTMIAANAEAELAGLQPRAVRAQVRGVELTELDLGSVSRAASTATSP